jgi:hypothetical protein
MNATNKQVHWGRYWFIECKERTYTSGCFDTKAEAVYRLGVMSVDPWYLADAIVTRQASDFFCLSDGARFEVVRN